MDGVKTRFVYGGWDVIQERNGSNQLSRSFLLSGQSTDGVVAFTNYNATTGAVTGSYFYLKDARGNVVALADTSANVVERYVYDPFGVPTRYDASWSPVSTLTAVGNPYYFQSRRHDSESGLYYYRMRYLDPVVGRFITPDPIGAWGDAMNVGNPYSFVGNNPWTYRDPFGLWWWDDDWLQMGFGGLFGFYGSDAAWEGGVGALQGTAVVFDTPGQIVEWLGWGQRPLKFLGAYEDTDPGIAYSRVGAGVFWTAGLAAGGLSAAGLDVVITAGQVCDVPEGPVCFVAGTLVSTPDGQKVIETFAIGDEVVSYDQETDTWSASTVTETFEYEFEGVLVTLSIEGDEIISTDDHPFWVVEGTDLQARPMAEHVPLSEQQNDHTGRWVDAGALNVGDVLLRRNGRSIVEGIHTSQDEITVYNIEVEGFHNYTVGASGVLVHNRPQRYDPDWYEQEYDPDQYDERKKGEKGKTFRGGRLKDRDNWGRHQNNQDLRRWWHQEKQKGNESDFEDPEEIFDEWVKQGRPIVD